MATTDDLTITPLSGLNHIDALLDSGPDWNFLTPAVNTLYYTFSVASGTEQFASGQSPLTSAVQSMTPTQQYYARSAFAYLTQLTGINFTETSDGTAAQVHLGMGDIRVSDTTGLCSWTGSYQYLSDGKLTSYDADAYVYLDNANFRSLNETLAPGTEGYDTLLHELGHMLGLQHPFDDAIRLPAAQDSGEYTIMSYNTSGTYGEYSPYDLAALSWLYGGDGLGGRLGIGSITGARLIIGSEQAETLTGTAVGDVLRGRGGNDSLVGGDGTDMAIFSGHRETYQFDNIAGGMLRVSGADGVDILSSIELLAFYNGVVLRADVDTSAPPAPTATVAHNALGYISVNTPLISGTAGANAVVKIHDGSQLIASAVADAQGLWSATSVALSEGAHVLSASVTDNWGNMSLPSSPLAINVDTLAPTVPTGAVRSVANQLAGNQFVFSGRGEAGTAILLVKHINQAGEQPAVLGTTEVDQTGAWSITSNPLANGGYNVGIESTDLAGNRTDAIGTLAFSVSSARNQVGTLGNDTLTGTSGNNALSGLDGLDYAVYRGVRDRYFVDQSTNGFTINGAEGFDSLYGVERIVFADKTLAIDLDGVGGKAFRLYQAAFDRQPDLEGLGYWIKQLDRGMKVVDVASEFINSPEFARLYGEKTSDAAFLTELYDNVLDRTPDSSGFAYWMWAMEIGTPRAQVLLDFSESPENRANVIGAIQDGFEYVPYLL